MRNKIIISFLIVSSILLNSCSFNNNDIQHVEAEIIEEYPLINRSFVQGLEYDNDNDSLLLSNGKYGDSELIRFKPGYQEISQKIDLDDKYFGEGLTVVNDKIYQLTWKENIVFVYDKNTFTKLDSHHLESEGWGICYHKNNLIVSDGSYKLQFFDNNDFHKTKEDLSVTYNGKKLKGLNELECVGDKIYANVLGDNNIYRINSATGEVDLVVNTNKIDKSTYSDPNDVLNGIARVPESDDLIVTGKNWHSLYRIRI